jgi:hypothetical protein
MNCPNLGIGQLPAEDREAGNDVRRALASLDSYVYRFEACLDLIERSDAEQNPSQLNISEIKQDSYKSYQVASRRLNTWCLIAERDATITIWDFSTTIYGIRKNLERCKSLNELVHRPTLEKVLKQLSADFPDRENARHAAAHPADMKRSSKELARHSVDGPIERPGIKVEEGAKGTFLGNFSTDGTVVTTYKGEIIEAKITRESLAALASLRDEMYACFKPAEQALMEALLASRVVPSDKLARPSWHLTPVLDQNSEIVLYDIYVGDEWAGSRRTKQQCYEAIRTAGGEVPQLEQ